MFTSLFQLEQRPVTVFSSSDVGAPVLEDSPGSLKTLLKACLVTGYGDKESLGWSMLFESDDLHAAAFVSQDSTSSKYVLKVDDGGDGALLSAYQSMSSIDVGEKPIVDELKYAYKGVDWMLIGHQKTFILLLRYPAAGSRKEELAFPLLFGDLPRSHKRITPVCVLWCSAEAHHYYNQIGGVQTTLFYSPDGSSGGNGKTRYYAPCNPFVISEGQSGSNLIDNHCRFDYISKAGSTLLFEPVLCGLKDGTWTFLPMLQPLSTKVDDVANMGVLTDDFIKIRTGYYYGDDSDDNLDCAVPIKWWYA